MLVFQLASPGVSVFGRFIYGEVVEYEPCNFLPIALCDVWVEQFPFLISPLCFSTVL